MLWVKSLSIAGGSAVTAVLERTFFQPFVQKKQKKKDVIIYRYCVVHTVCSCVLLLSVAVCAEYDLNVSSFCFVFIHKVYFCINVGLPMFCSVVSL